MQAVFRVPFFRIGFSGVQRVHAASSGQRPLMAHCVYCLYPLRDRKAGPGERLTHYPLSGIGDLYRGHLRSVDAFTGFHPLRAHCRRSPNRRVTPDCTRAASPDRRLCARPGFLLIDSREWSSDGPEPGLRVQGQYTSAGMISMFAGSRACASSGLDRRRV